MEPWASLQSSPLLNYMFSDVHGNSLVIPCHPFSYMQLYRHVWTSTYKTFSKFSVKTWVPAVVLEDSGTLQAIIWQTERVGSGMNFFLCYCEQPGDIHNWSEEWFLSGHSSRLQSVRVEKPQWWEHLTQLVILYLRCERTGRDGCFCSLDLLFFYLP